MNRFAKKFNAYHEIQKVHHLIQLLKKVRIFPAQMAFYSAVNKRSTLDLHSVRSFRGVFRTLPNI